MNASKKPYPLPSYSQLPSLSPRLTFLRVEPCASHDERYSTVFVRRGAVSLHSVIAKLDSTLFPSSSPQIEPFSQRPELQYVYDFPHKSNAFILFQLSFNLQHGRKSLRETDKEGPPHSSSRI